MRRTQDQLPGAGGDGEAGKSMPPTPTPPAAQRAVSNGLASEGLLRRELRGLESMASSRFLEIGRRLRTFYEALPESRDKVRVFKDLLADTKISPRTAQYWIDIDRIYSDLGVPEARLARVGWSKLSLLARYVNRRNVEDWLSFAEQRTANEVRARLSRSEPSTHHVVFKLSAAENAMLMAALVKHGARAISAKRLVGKEAALAAMCRRALGTPCETAHEAASAASGPDEDDDAQWLPSR